MTDIKTEEEFGNHMDALDKKHHIWVYRWVLQNYGLDIDNDVHETEHC